MTISGLNSICCLGNKRDYDARVPQEHIGSLYDKKAWIYDIWAYLTESNARNRAIELMGIENGQAILEVAVGTGSAFNEIAKRNPDGTNIGIDLSQGMLRKAKARLEKLPVANYSLELGSAFNLNCETASVDTLVNSYMFDLLRFEEMDKIIAEFKRVLKPGGKLVLVNMTKGEHFGSGLYEKIYAISPETMGGCRGVQLANKLVEHEFKVELREYYQQMLFPSEVILANR